MSIKNGKDYLYLIWKSEQTHTQYIVGQLAKNGMYEFSYSPDIDKAIKAGFTLLIAFPERDKVYQSQELFPAFSSRLPDKKRKDIKKILDKYDMKEFDAYTLLKMSGARLPIDNFQFIDPILDFEHAFERKFNLSGVRHYLGCNSKNCEISVTVTPGDEVIFEKDSENKFDHTALKVSDKDGVLLGYVPRYYSEAFTRFMDEQRIVNCFITNVNKNNNCTECISVKATVK